MNIIERWVYNSCKLRLKMENKENQKRFGKNSTLTLTMVNALVWIIAVIAMIILSQDAPQIKKIFPILAGGTAVAVTLFAAVKKEIRN